MCLHHCRRHPPHRCHFLPTAGGGCLLLVYLSLGNGLALMLVSRGIIFCGICAEPECPISSRFFRRSLPNSLFAPSHGPKVFAEQGGSSRDVEFAECAVDGPSPLPITMQVHENVAFKMLLLSLLLLSVSVIRIFDGMIPTYCSNAMSPTEYGMILGVIPCALFIAMRFLSAVARSECTSSRTSSNFKQHVPFILFTGSGKGANPLKLSA